MGARNTYTLPDGYVRHFHWMKNQRETCPIHHHPECMSMVSPDAQCHDECHFTTVLGVGPNGAHEGCPFCAESSGETYVRKVKGPPTALRTVGHAVPLSRQDFIKLSRQLDTERQTRSRNMLALAFYVAAIVCFALLVLTVAVSVPLLPLGLGFIAAGLLCSHTGWGVRRVD